jgi:lipoprotein Spr
VSLSPGEIVARARSLVGIPFRPQGRDPRIGLDCVGVVLCTFSIPPELIRRSYRLRGAHRREIETILSDRFNRVGAPSAGDVLLFAITSDQVHLAIHCGESFVHSDASLRRVVETPLAAAWPSAAIFRSRELLQPS